MKKIIMEFLRRGLISLGFGPIILAILYLILQHQGVVQYLTANQVCRGIFSLSALAFIAGGMNVIYQIEQIPLMGAILIHGSTLYISYLLTYLINGWLDWGTSQILVFSGIFVLGYLVIWAVIYSIVWRNTNQINEALEKNRKKEEKL